MAVRQARAVETRRRILDAARVAFAAKGHDANLTLDILEPAGVSVGSFYHQFADKTELLVAVLRDGAAWRRRHILADAADSGEGADDVLRRSVERFYDGLESQEADWRIQLRERGNPDPRVQAAIRAARHEFRSEMAERFRRHANVAPDRIEAAAGLFFSFMTGLATTYYDTPVEQRSRAAVDAAVDDAVAFLRAGLTAVLFA